MMSRRERAAEEIASGSRGLTIGRRLRELRTGRSWSQVELASRAAVGVATVRRYERGFLRVESLLKLSQALGTSLDELVAPADPNPCRRAVLERLPACAELPPYLAPLLVSMMDLVLQLHRSAEELAALRRAERRELMMSGEEERVPAAPYGRG